MKISLIGPPGSGKGTVAKKFIKEFHYHHIYPGELLREEVKKKTKIGQKIKIDMERGDLVDHKIVAKLIKKRIGRKRNYLIDGFPRSMEQIKLIIGKPIEKVVFFKVSESVVVQRLSGRRVCKRGHTYHIINLPPKIKNKCDHDNLPLFRRKDDSAKSIRERFRVYHKKTESVINYYKKQKMLITINASNSPEKVYTEFKKRLKAL